MAAKVANIILLIVIRTNEIYLKLIKNYIGQSQETKNSD